MLSIQKCPVPAGTMLEKYLSIGGAYIDAYTTDIHRHVTFPEFVFAFYTTPLFKLERIILTTMSLPSTDTQALGLADGATEKFAAWTVESRSRTELVMCDVVQRTRSWLMVNHADTITHLYFGSAVVPKTGNDSLEFGYRAFMGFHQLYSILLLYSAKAKLRRGR